MFDVFKQPSWWFDSRCTSKSRLSKERGRQGGVSQKLLPSATAPLQPVISTTSSMKNKPVVGL